MFAGCNHSYSCDVAGHSLPVWPWSNLLAPHRHKGSHCLSCGAADAEAVTAGSWQLEQYLCCKTAGLQYCSSDCQARLLKAQVTLRQAFLLLPLLAKGLVHPPAPLLHMCSQNRQPDNDADL